VYKICSMKEWRRCVRRYSWWKKIDMMQQCSTSWTTFNCWFETLTSSKLQNVSQSLSVSSLETVCLTTVNIQNFLTNQLVKEFWKSVHICQSYYQTWRGLVFWNTVYLRSARNIILRVQQVYRRRYEKRCPWLPNPKLH